MQPSDVSGDPTLLNVINLTDIAIRRIIKMAKKLAAFKTLCQEDQIALLKGGCTELMILRSVMTYDADKGCWKVRSCFFPLQNDNDLHLPKKNSDSAYWVTYEPHQSCSAKRGSRQRLRRTPAFCSIVWPALEGRRAYNPSSVGHRSIWSWQTKRSPSRCNSFGTGIILLPVAALPGSNRGRLPGAFHVSEADPEGFRTSYS